MANPIKYLAIHINILAILAIIVFVLIAILIYKRCHQSDQSSRNPYILVSSSSVNSPVNFDFVEKFGNNQRTISGVSDTSTPRSEQSNSDSNKSTPFKYMNSYQHSYLEFELTPPITKSKLETSKTPFLEFSNNENSTNYRIKKSTSFSSV